MNKLIITILLLFPICLFAQDGDKEEVIYFKVYIDSSNIEKPFVIRGHIINGPFPYPKSKWMDSLDHYKFRVILNFEDNCKLTCKVSYIEGKLIDEQINAIISETTELIKQKRVIFVASNYTQNCESILSIWKERSFEFVFGRK